MQSSEQAPRPFLGVCLIIRDASKTIEALLNSMKGAADEWVIVDTGSADDTREKICKFFGIARWPNSDDKDLSGYSRGPINVILGNFKWVDDFAAARNYSFSLGTAKWRMWLDADDQVRNADLIKPALQRTDSAYPHVNSISIPYEYAPHENWQDKVNRIVRWQDGWRWEGEIHEDLNRYPPGPRFISKFQRPDGRPEVIVEHRPPGDHGMESIVRNTRICNRIYEKSHRAGDARKGAIMAFYLGSYARIFKKFDEAKKYLLEAGSNLGPTNLACLALCELVRLELDRERPFDAIEYASLAITKAPELPDGWGSLGVAMVETGQYQRANSIFDKLFSMPQPQLQSTRDLVWNDGVVWATAALSYIAEGQMGKAEEALRKIPEPVIPHERVWMKYSRALADYYKVLGVDTWKKAVDYLVWNNEPVKALRLLESDLIPSNVEASPLISRFKDEIWDKMQQMKSWADYKRVYAAECNEVFDRDEDGVKIIRDMGRAEQAVKWANQLHKEGDPFQIYVIGIHGGWIEEFCMDANPRIHLTACDVNPNANTAIQRLIKKFPGRVSFHTVVKDHYDWIPEGKRGFYDAVFCFEVIEHVPDDYKLLATINQLLKIGGELLLSTPVGEYWVAPDATKRHHWHQHVRAYQPHQLWQAVRDNGFGGDLFSTDNRILFFGQFVKESAPRAYTFLNFKGLHYPSTDMDAPQSGPKISIVIPSTPQGFDPISIQEGHVGGSEEAVIHLAPELAKLGAEVTVYVDKKPDRAGTVHVVQNVLWRPMSEFDVKRVEGTLFVWRSPQYAAQYKRDNQKLRVINWMHDIGNRATVADYETVDGTIALSVFHEQAIAEHDGFQGPFLRAPNGIVPEEFDFTPKLSAWITRDPFKCIYASAPNRGLDTLLAIWPRIKAFEPRASLDIYYGWEITEQMMERDANLKAEMGPLLKHLREKIKDLGPMGVRYIGGVDHETLNSAYAGAGVWTYPTEFPETFCISALRAQAAGCIPVTTTAGALPEVIDPHNQLFDLEKDTLEDFIHGVVNAMHGKTPRRDEIYPRTTARNWALSFSWKNAALKFLEHAQKKTQKVVIFAGSGREFDETSLHQPNGFNLGGSEEAVIVLADALAEKGVSVEVVGRCKSHKTPNGVQWSDSTTNPLDRVPKGTPVINWRYPTISEQIKKGGHKTLLWLMDPGYDAAPMLYEASDAVVGLTEAHRRIIGERDGYEGPMEIIPNGLQLNELPPLSIQNDQGRNMQWIMWATSPDRGLLPFLQDWMKVKEAAPNAQLHIFYGMDAMMYHAQINQGFAEKYRVAELKALLDKLAAEPATTGVYYHGSATRSELMAWHVRCGVFAYPVVGFEETFCITAVKAMACGMWPVMNDLGSLPEISGGWGKIVGASESYKDALIQVLKSPPPFEQRKRMADWARDRYSSQKMAEKFLKLLERLR